MTQSKRVRIKHMATGVPGLDAVMGGGIPEYSFNLIAGEPGGGKTTFAHQVMFTNATPERPALYFTVLGEPAVKMLRYQQQYSFFDPDKVGEAVRFVNLSDEVKERGLGGVLERIVAEVEASSPSLVVVDSFRTAIRATREATPDEAGMRSFVQQLALHLTSWQVTSFLVGEYMPAEQESDPVFTIADAILWFSQATDRNSVVRKIQVVKVRGQAQMPGLHTFKITGDGLRVFPRISLAVPEEDRLTPRGRVSTGVEAVDALMGGGIPRGDSVLVTGPSGSGKSVLATQFIAEGVKQGEPGVLVVFEEHPKEYIHRAQGLGFPLQKMVKQGMLEVMYLRPLDLSPDETLFEIREAAARVSAQRVVIDSMSGFELALAPTFRTDFRESLYRLIGALTGVGITVLTTMEIVQDRAELRFTPNVVSFLADDLVLLRYCEVDRQMKKVLAVAKMRGSQHSKEFREYEITSRGLEVGGGLDGYRGGISGAPYLTTFAE
ncbi:MAG TPA: ATPase domain-containing protein [Longimicrobiaceae bacterium]|nr:ATPase domain-containing protein [Longimicrobiaceae bacterium]